MAGAIGEIVRVVGVGVAVQRAGQVFWGGGQGFGVDCRGEVLGTGLAGGGLVQF